MEHTLFFFFFKQKTAYEIAGVKSVLLQAPLGTYTSWNPVSSGPLKGNEGNLAAGYIPFAVTKAARLASDPRRSVEERYGSQQGYNCLVTHIAKKEVRKRFLLQEDADRLIAQAAAASPVFLPSDPNNRTARELCEKLDRDDDHHDHDGDDNDDDD